MWVRLVHIELQVCATHHRIELCPGSKTSHKIPHLACSETPGIIENDLQTQVDARVIGQAQSEWDSPVLLVPEKDGKLRFASTFDASTHPRLRTYTYYLEWNTELIASEMQTSFRRSTHCGVIGR